MTALKSKSSILQALGQRLQAERVSQNLTQRDLSARSSVPYSTLRKIETTGVGSLGDFVSMLMALGQVEQLDHLLPPRKAPNEVVIQAAGHVRTRARKTHIAAPKPKSIESSPFITNRKTEIPEGSVSARYFQTVDAMADYQVDRELQEALRVQSMPPEERFQWLTETWGRLQDGASSLFADLPQQPGAARCYASFEEKNRFEEDRELKYALQRQQVAA